MPDLREQLQSSLGDAYTIERELGGGGMSRVFLAVESALGRRVVIKVLPTELSGSASIARFRREISLAARLQHPHIVPLIAAGDMNGLPFFTMPFVDGDSLRARLAHGELPIAETISILRDVAKALDHAHGMGVTHRDIKPDNVLLAGSSAVITDFGVAKALREAAQNGPLTSVGVALGTPAYMAPEQSAADPATDLRADVYAFGAMAYEMLAGHPPFAGRNVQAVLAAHATEVPIAIGTLRPATPAALATLVMRCLEKRPGDRPQSAKELLLALDTLSASGGGQSSTVSAPSRRDRRGLRAAGVMVAGLCVLALVAWWRMHPGNVAPAALRSIAILPFENTSRDTAFDYLENGITDHVRDALNAMPGLTVKARSSSQLMKGKNAREIGAKLDVFVVLQGTVSRSGTRLHVTTELVRTSDESAIWSRTFDGQSTELPGIQDTISRAIARVLQLKGTESALSGNGARGTGDVEAYDLFLRGRYAKDRFDVKRSIDLFNAAIQRDPRFARAYGFLAIVYGDAPLVGLMSVDSATMLMRAIANKALAIDSTVAEGYVAQSYVLEADYTRIPDAIRVLEHGLAVDSGNVDLLWNYGLALAQTGRVQEGLEQTRRARAKDPLRVIGLYGKLLVMAHQFDEALTQTRAVLALDPGHVLAYRELGMLYAFTGKPDSSLMAFETAYRLDPTHFGTGANLVFGYAVAGRWKDAERQRALNERDRNRNSPNYDHAIAAIAFGEYDAAMTALERAVTQGDAILGTMSIPCDLVFGALKSNPRFPTLMNRIGAKACPATDKWPVGKRGTP